MAYTKTVYVNDSTSALNATNLNNSENGIKFAHNSIDADGTNNIALIDAISGYSTENIVLPFEQGAVSLGSEVEMTTRIRSPFLNIKLFKDISFTVAAGYEYYVEFYDSARKFKSFLSGGWQSTNKDYTFSSGEYYIRVVIRKSNNANISPSDSSYLTITGKLLNCVKVVSLSSGQNIKSGKFITNGVTYIQTGLANVSNDVPSEYSSQSNATIVSYVLRTSDQTLVQQYIFNNTIAKVYFRVINTAGTVVRDWTLFNNDFEVNEYISNPANLYSFDFNGIIWLRNINSTVQQELPQEYIDHNITSCFLLNIDYELNGQYFEQFVFNNALNKCYFRVVSSSGTIARDWTLFAGGMSGSPENKWYVLGDSISAGYFSITEEEAEEKGYTISYKPSDYGYPVYGVGAVWDSSLAHNYWGYANQWFLKRNLQPKAYPGQGYLKQSANNQNGIYVVKNNTFDDASLITVAWGFNDWHYDMTRGDHNLIDSNVPYPTENYDTSQLTTINHAIWYCLGELIRKCPNAKIVVQTPMNGWLYGGDWDSNWGIGYSMEHSGRLRDIHDDIVYWADYYGLEILEMTYNNSIVNRRNIQDVLLDGSHPTDEAHKQLGRIVGSKLNYI